MSSQLTQSAPSEPSSAPPTSSTPRLITQTATIATPGGSSTPTTTPTQGGTPSRVARPPPPRFGNLGPPVRNQLLTAALATQLSPSRHPGSSSNGPNAANTSTINSLPRRRLNLSELTESDVEISTNPHTNAIEAAVAPFVERDPLGTALAATAVGSNARRNLQDARITSSTPSSNVGGLGLDGSSIHPCRELLFDETEVGEHSRAGVSMMLGVVGVHDVTHPRGTHHPTDPYPTYSLIDRELEEFGLHVSDFTQAGLSALPPGTGWGQQNPDLQVLRRRLDVEAKAKPRAETAPAHQRGEDGGHDFVIRSREELVMAQRRVEDLVTNAQVIFGVDGVNVRPKQVTRGKKRRKLQPGQGLYEAEEWNAHQVVSMKNALLDSLRKLDEHLKVEEDWKYAQEQPLFGNTRGVRGL